MLTLYSGGSRPSDGKGGGGGGGGTKQKNFGPFGSQFSRKIRGAGPLWPSPGSATAIPDSFSREHEKLAGYSMNTYMWLSTLEIGGEALRVWIGAL